jgi:hypothetical protein
MPRFAAEIFPPQQALLSALSPRGAGDILTIH